MIKLARKKVGRPRGDEKVQVTFRLSQQAYYALTDELARAREALKPSDPKITIGDVAGRLILSATKEGQNEGKDDRQE